MEVTVKINKSIPIFLMVLIAFLLSSNAQAFWGSKKKIAQPKPLSQVADQMDEELSYGFQEVFKKIRAGKIVSGSAEATVELVKVVDKVFSNYNFSMDKTFRVVINQRNDDFWAKIFNQAGYNRVFWVVFQGMEDTKTRKMMLFEGLITAETISSWSLYLKWSKK